MIIIGKIGNPYGILGWVRITSFTEIKENIFKYFPWKLENSKIQFKKNDLIKYKINTSNFIAKIKNINNRNQAYKITKKNILIHSKQLPKLNKKEYYLKDVQKCYLYNLKKEKIGPVVHILENKIYNTLQVLYTKKNKTIYIPFICPFFIKIIDIDKKIIIASWDNYT